MDQTLQDSPILQKRSGDAAMTATGVKVFQAAALAVVLGACAVALLVSFQFSESLEAPFDLPIFLGLFLQYDRLPLLLIASAIGLVLVIPLRPVSLCARRLGWMNALARRPLVLPAVVTILLCCGSVFVYHNHPLCADEFAELFQSKVFASGHLFGKFPPSLVGRLLYPKFINYFFLLSPATGAIASSYWPGFALLLTPFTAAHIAWACNPVLGGFSLWLMYRIVVEISGDSSAGVWAMLLAIASPTFVVNAISYYSMQAHLCLNLLFVYLLLQGGWRQIVMAGLVGSLALSLHNPLPHVAFALPWIVWSLLRKGGLRRTLILAVAYLPLGLPLVVGWTFVRGLVSSGQITVASDSDPAPTQPASGPADQPRVSSSAVAQAASYGEKLLTTFTLPDRDVLEDRAIEGAKLIAWNVPALIALAGLGVWRFRGDWRAITLGASAVVTVLPYLLVHFNQGHGWGDRYFHSAWGTLPILGGLALATRPIGQSAGDGTQLGMPVLALRGTVVLFVIFSIGVLVPMRLFQVETFISRDLEQVPPHDPNVPSVVFLAVQNGYYAQDLIQNDPFLRDPVVYMLSKGAREDAALIRAAFPGFVGQQFDTGSVWTARETASPPPHGGS